MFPNREDNIMYAFDLGYIALWHTSREEPRRTIDLSCLLLTGISVIFHN